MTSKYLKYFKSFIQLLPSKLVELKDSSDAYKCKPTLSTYLLLRLSQKLMTL